MLAAVTPVLATLALQPALAAASGPTVSAYDSLATIRADRPLPAGGTEGARISAAGNEFESFQIAVQAGTAPLSGVSVQGGPLRGPGDATIPASALTVYRETDYTVSQPSDAEGGVGSWPDALIPERDNFYGENRDAFPFDLAPGQKLAVWVDVLVPRDQRGGTYRGAVWVTSSNGLARKVPVELRVYGFSIPSTSSLRSLFHVKGISLPGGDQSLFAAAALDNRVTIANLWPFPESRFQSQILPLLQGTDSRVMLPGAKLTALDAYHCAANCLAPWRDLASRYPDVASRFIDYICDEPSSAQDWSDCNSTAATAEQIWPGVRKLVTTDAAHLPSWATDLSPLVNDVDRDGQTQYRNLHRRKITRSTPPRRLWPYTSCRSYSCDESQSSEYTGWPGYAIDQPASQARAMGWLAYEGGDTGELYYSTTSMISTAWSNQYQSGGNGDGTLFYPGTPDVIGGTHPIPIESIRLKRIRDGREDYEYLHLLAAQGQRSEANQVVRDLFGPPATAMQHATVKPALLTKARRQLAAAILSHQAGTKTS